MKTDEPESFKCRLLMFRNVAVRQSITASDRDQLVFGRQIKTKVKVSPEASW